MPRREDRKHKSFGLKSKRRKAKNQVNKVQQDKVSAASVDSVPVTHKLIPVDSEASSGVQSDLATGEIGTVGSSASGVTPTVSSASPAPKNALTEAVHGATGSSLIDPVSQGVPADDIVQQPVRVKKIKGSGAIQPDSASPCYRLIDMNQIQFECVCGSVRVTCIEKCKKGLASFLSFECMVCHATVASFWTSKQNEGRAFDVNSRAVLGFRELGCGYAGVESFCKSFNMPTLCKSSFEKCQASVKTAVKNKTEAWKLEVANRIREAYVDIDPANKEKDVIDISVSYDGTWQKRGHTSHNGAGVVIDVVTGLVLDLEILSNFCRGCSIMQSQLGKGEFETWKAAHIAEGKCEKNHDGSAGMMECVAAERLWERSVKCFGLRYTTLVSDGDAKTFKLLTDLKVYGDIPLVKEECVNHVAKRLGAGLRKFVSQSKARGETVGGKGKLTVKRMTQ